jgi:hypothetical protein
MFDQITPREIGIPVRSATNVLLFAGADAAGAPCLYATMGQMAAPFFVLRIDPATGAAERFTALHPGDDEAVCAHWSARWGCLFAGVWKHGHFYRFDPRVGAMECLGQIRPDDPEAACFPCGIAEHPDGSLFIGSYGKCDLTRFDPATGVFTPYGRLDEIDMYCYPRCGDDGTVAALVRMTRPHVVALDPLTGERRIVGPVADVQSGEGHVELITGEDGLLYITSHAGDFRVQGLEAVPVEAAPAPRPKPTLPGGVTFRFADADRFAFHELELTAPDGTSHSLSVAWEGDGTDIFLCHAGPDGKLYGSSILPEHLFKHDPDTGEVADLGACSTSGGEAYSMGNLDGKLYIASYPAAKLSVYDPAKPYRFGTDPGANPRELGRMDQVAYRPRGMTCGPGGKVWVASQPDYGMWGGTLAWYDPATETFGSHRNLYPDCSGYTTEAVPELDALLVGFSIEAGTGCQPRAERAGVILWNPHADAEIWRSDFGLAITSVEDLCAAGDEMVYAVLKLADEDRPVVALLDLREQMACGTCRLEPPGHGDLFWGMRSMFRHGQYVYGATYQGLYRVRIGDIAVDALWIAPDGGCPSGTGAVIGNTWYFPTGHRLRALELPT